MIFTAVRSDAGSPALIMISASSEVRIPPEASTPTLSGSRSRNSSTSLADAPPARLVES
jgi:hypothetical protein